MSDPTFYFTVYAVVSLWFGYVLIRAKVCENATLNKDTPQERTLCPAEAFVGCATMAALWPIISLWFLCTAVVFLTLVFTVSVTMVIARLWR